MTSSNLVEIGKRTSIYAIVRSAHENLDSLKVQRLVQQLRKECSLNVRVVELFSRVTFAAQAELIVGSGARSPRTALLTPAEPVKLRGKALTAPVSVSAEQVQQRIISLWADVLGVQPSKATSDFFDLGGNRYGFFLIF
jgi:hypothetical protein